MAFRPVLGVLAFVTRGDAVLLVHRTADPADEQYGLFNGLGGKIEPDEDAVAALRRELREEAGIEATALTLRGTLSWPAPRGAGEDWFGFVFRVDAFAGEPPARNAEGTLHWVPRAELTGLRLSPGDAEWLPHVFDEDVASFHGVVHVAPGVRPRLSVSLLRRRPEG
ncbi:8-oxo-dGTP diphosphatase [Propioniciclava coleopterorum]|uniref:8-oxo-dGTP diphosphatase n=1 Tax=Propioniciclava coleopterorum TaxID=2714937 RepID=A0A6G7Y445_9ACTN|nr:8-oxo-dGTP diphosphatase [Propioniciclava coleopterorum]QIK71387.1 8-oxo-dGTP diphosphatase [Propioniciclava coleopterorum]